MSRSKRSIERLNLLGGMMTSAEVRRLQAGNKEIRQAMEKAGLPDDRYHILRGTTVDETYEGAARLLADMGKIGVGTLTDLTELASLRKRAIPDNRLHDYKWIHTHVCEYLKQFHPSENQALIEQSRAAH